MHGRMDERFNTPSPFLIQSTAVLFDYECIYRVNLISVQSFQKYQWQSKERKTLTIQTGLNFMDF
jgi:hypothetical protein